MDMLIGALLFLGGYLTSHVLGRRTIVEIEKPVIKEVIVEKPPEQDERYLDDDGFLTAKIIPSEKKEDKR